MIGAYLESYLIPQVDVCYSLMKNSKKNFNMKIICISFWEDKNFFTFQLDFSKCFFERTSIIIYIINVKLPNLDLKLGIGPKAGTAYLEREAEIER